MNPRGCLWLLIVPMAILLLFAVLGSFYAVDQTEQVIITQFGKPVGDPITEPGLHFKARLVQRVHRLDKRFLEWEGASVAIPTRDKTYIHVVTFARWRIEDPKTYFVRLHDERRPSRASKTFSAAKRATPSPNTTLSKSCAPTRTASHCTTRPSKAAPPAPSASSHPSRSAG